MRYLFILIVLLTVSCSKEKGEAPKSVPPIDQGVVKDQEVVKDQKLEEAPMGEECEKYFPQDALKNEENFTNGIYVAERIYTAIKMDRKKPTVLMMQLGYIKDYNSLYLFVHTLGSPVCYEEKSPMIISLPGDNDDSTEYELKGLHKAHCGTAKKAEDPNKSFTLFKLPIESYFFQAALETTTKDFNPINMRNDALTHIHYNSDHANYFMNGLRCAYSAMGHKHYLKRSELENNLWKSK
jgi:hypothetical protein